MEKIPQLKAPPGTCDTHLHVYDKRFPVAPTALFPAPDAPLAAYRPVQRRLGVDRIVIVQPTTYGTDNRSTLDGIAAFGSGARGIVVVESGVADVELQRLTDLGVRGIRYHMLPGGVLAWESLPEMAARVQEVGWHVQLQMDGRLFAERELMLRRLPGTLVVDHVGRFHAPVAVDDPAFVALCRLVESGRCWVKLSAPYESANAGPPAYPQTSALAKALVKLAPQRMVWASNWPHPSLKDPPDEADLLDLLLDWAPDETTRRRILVDNPAVLYGF